MQAPRPRSWSLAWRFASACVQRRCSMQLAAGNPFRNEIKLMAAMLTMLVDFVLDSILYGCNAGVNAIPSSVVCWFQGSARVAQSVWLPAQKALPTLSSTYKSSF